MPVFATQPLVTPEICKIKVQMESIQLSTDGGATWTSDILGGASSYIEFNSDEPSGQIFGYFKQGVQVDASTYNKVRVVLNPVVQAYIKATIHGTGTFYFKDGLSFDQSVGLNHINDLTQIEAEAGWCNMTLTSGYETITTDFLSGSGGNTTLVINNGINSTIRVEILNVFNVYDIDDSHTTTTCDPHTDTLIYVQ